jgi:putative component of membrane protein insertase Oxa1/YidC/SpoIIIJ protein YidD
MEAVARYGVVKGGLKTVWRLARCHPIAKGGLDPVVSCHSPLPAGNEPHAVRVPLKESTS